MNKRSIQVNLEQGSSEWLDYRRDRIMASDVSVIMGDNPWKSPLNLYNDKISGESAFFNSAMQRGQKLEPMARGWAINKFKTLFIPNVYQHGKHHWLGASLDGISFDGKTCIEIKCGLKSHELAKEGVIPEYYKWQMLCQMEVMNLDKIYYISYQSDDDVIMMVYERDDLMIASMLAACEKFYTENLCSKNPPSDKSDCEDMELIDDIDRKTRLEINFENRARLKDKIKYLEGLVEHIDEELIEDARGISIKLGNHKCLKYYAKGSVDYKSIEVLRGINLDKYRKETTSRWRIS